MTEDVLKRIYAAKAPHVASDKARESYDEITERARASTSSRRSFLAALRSPDAAVIAEVKRASPSAGLIARDFDPVAIARTYEAAGAHAVSVLTEADHFLGDLAFLPAVRGAIGLPLLRKDFLTERYEIAQAAAYGADAVLLIVAGLTDQQLDDCLDEAARYELDALVEVHDERDLTRALQRESVQIVGINNRNLRTMVTDLAVSEHLLPKVPPRVFAVSESGMRGAGDLERLRAAGARGFLIGEALMRADDPGSLIASLRTEGAGVR